MKTTIEIPDQLFRRAKATAAQRGISLKDLVSEALTDKLQKPASEEKPWMKMCGGLRHLKKETARINKIIEEEFEQIDPGEWE